MLQEGREITYDASGRIGESTRTGGAAARRPAGAPTACRSYAAAGHAGDVIAAISTAVLCADHREGARQLRAILDGGVSRRELREHYIPEGARRFGAAWADSSHSFAEVTIAVARLQGWLREIGDDAPPADFRLDAPEVLIVIPAGSQHTLGAMVAMSMFRRLGALVRLSMGQDARATGAMVRGGNFDMVAVSAAGSEDLETLGNLINSVRSGVAPAPPVVLGGEILNVHPDAPSLLGVDHATSDPEEALSACGLTISADAVSPGAAEQRITGGHPARAPSPA